MVVLSTFGRRLSSRPLTSSSSSLLIVAFPRISAERQISQLKYDQLPVPPPPKIKWQPPPTEKGHLQYERYWSRNPAYKPQMPRDTMIRFYLHHLQHEHELWPLCFILICSNLLILWIAWICCNHIECELDRTQKYPPWEWSRCRDNYWKLPTQLYDPLGETHTRLFIMEELQDKMLEESRKRGHHD